MKGIVKFMLMKDMDKSQLEAFLAKEKIAYDALKAKNLNLDMSRGKPGSEQLELSNKMLEINDFIAENGLDCRNYGVLDGIPEAKKLFSEVMQVSEDEIIIGGNSSLNLMYDTLLRAMQFGVLGGEKPWSKCEKIKFLCPVPGYDRHFAITEKMGIEMINVPMTASGPDMDTIEMLVLQDEDIKGIWCVPKYSNPDGITYSDETVKRLAQMKTKASDFRIFWDNAYCVHDLKEVSDPLLNILDECKKVGTQNRVFVFGSTSKISFSGGGLAFVCGSKENIDFIKKDMSVQTIGSDKINQLRHVKFFKNLDGIKAHMAKHREILAPKFNVVLQELDKEIAPLGIATWFKPNGGYFISFNTLEGVAKRVGQLCKEIGITLTNVGATFPCGFDPKDQNIRIAPTYPSVDELKIAIDVFCVCVKIATCEKMLNIY